MFGGLVMCNEMLEYSLELLVSSQSLKFSILF